METINGCTVVPPSEAPEPVHFGPAETQGAYVVMVGTFPPGQPAPPLHVHPHTDETFYVADGDATFQLGDREVHSAPVPSSSCPGGCPTVWNSGDRAVRGLILVSPGGGARVRPRRGLSSSRPASLPPRVHDSHRTAAFA
jgi:hypothetical protein